MTIHENTCPECKAGLTTTRFCASCGESYTLAQLAICWNKLPDFASGRRTYVYSDGSAVFMMTTREKKKDAREVWYFALDQEDLKGDAWEK